MESPGTNQVSAGIVTPFNQLTISTLTSAEGSCQTFKKVNLERHLPGKRRCEDTQGLCQIVHPGAVQQVYNLLSIHSFPPNLTRVNISIGTLDNTDLTDLIMLRKSNQCFLEQ